MTKQDFHFLALTFFKKKKKNFFFVFSSQLEREQVPLLMLKGRNLCKQENFQTLSVKDGKIWMVVRKFCHTNI